MSEQRRFTDDLGENHSWIKSESGPKDRDRGGRPRIVVAKYNGRCKRCQIWMPKGTRIAFYGRGTAVHIECLPSEIREWAREQAKGSRA